MTTARARQAGTLELLPSPCHHLPPLQPCSPPGFVSRVQAKTAPLFSGS